MTTRIEFKIDIDEDFSSDEISQSETNTLQNKHFGLLTQIKAKLEATLYSLGYDIERSKLNVFEINGTYLHQKKNSDDEFIINEIPFDLSTSTKFREVE